MAVLCLTAGGASYASAQSLPPGFSRSAIGSPALPGSATFSSAGVLTVNGAGVDIWGQSDQFTFVHRTMLGDGVIVARVTSLQHRHDWSKAAVMMRESLASGSKHASMLVSSTKGLAFQRRVATSGLSVHTTGGTGAAPVWLKLERKGSTFTASRSSDGAKWTVVGSQSITMAATVYVGLAVTSRNVSATASATFERVLVQTPSAPLVSLTSPSDGTRYTAPASIAMSASASDPNGVARVDFYAGSTLIGSDTTSPYSLTWSQVPPGTYSLTAVARSGTGATTVSAHRTISVYDAQLPGVAVFVPSPSHATVVSYGLALFPSGSDPRTANAIAVRNLGKPPVVNGECRADILSTIAALPPGKYVAVVLAVGLTGVTQSTASAPFTR